MLLLVFRALGRSLLPALTPLFLANSALCVRSAGGGTTNPNRERASEAR
jgi:hypothetical protein